MHIHMHVYFLALIAEEGFLISSCYSLELYIQMLYIFPFLHCFSLLFFSQLFVRPAQTAILLFCIYFYGNGLDPCLLFNVTNFIPEFIRHSTYRLPGEISITSDMQMAPPLWQRVKRNSGAS